MKKVKYQGGITKYLMSQLGKRNKNKFAKMSVKDMTRLVDRFEKRDVDMDVVSLSSNNDYQEQILSILSYHRFVGEPKSWTVYSDGSHSPEQISQLETVFPYVKVKSVDLFNADEVRAHMKERLLPYFETLFHYAQNHPMGKKLFYYINHPINNPTLFIDSDILFYRLAGESFERVQREDVSGWFLPDQVWNSLDGRYKSKHKPQVYQINAGFFLLNRELENLEIGMEFIKEANGDYMWFTEQTCFHILLRENKCSPLDPRIFILNSSDQFDFSYGYQPKYMASRHYTGPVRHKMWQRDWKWQLSLEQLS